MTADKCDLYILGAWTKEAVQLSGKIEHLDSTRLKHGTVLMWSTKDLA